MIRFVCVLASLLLMTCTTKEDIKRSDYAPCAISYKTSDLYFKESDVLTFKLRFVYFADSIKEATPNYDSILAGINDFFKSSRIQFIKYDKQSVVKYIDSDMKRDMPSFIKYHMRDFKNDSTITMYIYGNEQPNYSESFKSIAGSAGGIGSNFFAVKEKYVYETTVFHELCHCFFLLHTSEPDPTEKGLDLMYGDKICDLIKSEPIDFVQNDTCEVERGTGLYSKEEINEVLCNIMSYTYNMNCRKCITNNQKARMRFYIHESPAMRLTLVE